tara:strand:- start:10067 stop:10813 length:747 start_codon:yes stop_codon:yes gene_type:complete
MINNTQLQIKFRQRLNKLASNDFDNIECWQIVEAFNKAQREWVRRQLHGSNQLREGDERSKKRIDDLQLLINTSTFTTGGVDLPGNSCIAFDLPDNYMEFKRANTYGVHECCELPRPMTVYLAEVTNVDLNLRDTLKCPSFEWAETFCTLQNNQIRFYYRPEALEMRFNNKPFEVTFSALTYYREPTPIEIQGCTDPATGGTSPMDIICEFKDDVAELIIDDAVAIIAGDINDVNQYMRGNSNAEKNN